MIRDDQRHFWNEWSRGHLVLQTCDACGSKRFYPAPLCPVCSHRDFAWRAAAGSGNIYSFTHVPARQPEAEPGATIVLVDLPEEVRVLGVLDGPSDIEVGAAVAIAPDGADHGPIRFELA